MKTSDRKTSISSLILREDFKQKLQTWFENKGIKNKLEMYLRSQMIMEFQQNCGNSINAIQNTSVSPKIQAVKLLIADFLVQEDLLFSLSVFCSEVPFLNNLTHFCSYVSHLARPQNNISVSKKPTKLKFSNTDICNILDALGLNLNKEEIHIIRDKYETSKFSSLLVCLLCMLPILLKKYRNVERVLSKTKKKEKYLKKLAKTERIKTKQMYSVLQNAHSVVQKHKTEMNIVSQKEDQLQKYITAVEEKLSELSKKETELMNWQKLLESKENDFEESYEDRVDEIEKKLKILTEQDHELQSKYKILQEEQAKVKTERDHIEEQKKLMTSSKSHEIIKLEEYELKFRLLQDEVKEILKQCVDAQKIKSGEENQVIVKDVRYRFDTQNQSQQTECDVFINIEEYVNLMEKENSLLKLNSNKQRYHINQLTSEIMFLKNQLDYLQKENDLRNQFQQEEMVNKVAHKLYFRNKCWHSEEKNKKYRAFLESESENRAHFKRRLFDDINMLKSSELSSSDNSKESNLTDEIVADAKNKLNELENESKALNRNFKNLQSVLSRNIALNDRIFGCSSVSDSSPNERKPRFNGLSRSISDFGSLNLSNEVKQVLPELNLQKFEENILGDTEKTPKNSKENPSVSRKNIAFRNVFLKYKKNKINTVKDEDKIQLEHSSKSSFEDNEIVTNLKEVNDTKLLETLNAQNLIELSVQTVKEKNLTDNENLISNIDTLINKTETTQDNKTWNSEKKLQSHTENEIKENDICGKQIESSNKNNVSRELFPTSHSNSKSEGSISGASVDTKSSSDFWK